MFWNQNKSTKWEVKVKKQHLAFHLPGAEIRVFHFPNMYSFLMAWDLHSSYPLCLLPDFYPFSAQMSPYTSMWGLPWLSYRIIIPSLPQPSPRALPTLHALLCFSLLHLSPFNILYTCYLLTYFLSLLLGFKLYKNRNFVFCLFVSCCTKSRIWQEMWTEHLLKTLLVRI